MFSDGLEERSRITHEISDGFVLNRKSIASNEWARVRLPPEADLWSTVYYLRYKFSAVTLYYLQSEHVFLVIIQQPGTRDIGAEEGHA